MRYDIPLDAINKNASKVFFSGIQYNDKSNITCPHSESPMPTRKTPWNALDIRGKRFGRLLVIGMHANIKGSWVVKCSCGDYETRKYKALKNPNNYGDRCVKCRKKAYEKKSHAYHMLGKELDCREL